MRKTILSGFVSVFILGLITQMAHSAIYSEPELAEDRPRIKARVAELHRRLTLPEFLKPEERGLAHVEVLIPNSGPSGHPAGFAAVEGKVHMPLRGLKFIEDLTMAYAWRLTQEQTFENFDVYLAMLRYKPPADWPEGRLMDPLEAFGVPDRIWETDPAVGTLGTRMRNDAWAFILAHELAHVLFKHPGNAGVDPAISRRNEEQADRFALDLLNRTQTVPVGAVIYFQSSVAFYPNRADFASDDAFSAWQTGNATHPINAQRMQAMAMQMLSMAGENEDPALTSLRAETAARLSHIADLLGDPMMQLTIMDLAMKTDPRRLADP